MKSQMIATFKILVIGDSGVGKTSMLMRYCQNNFQSDLLSTVGVDFKIKRVKIQNQDVCFNIWDTAGQQRFRNITKSFYKNAHGIILTYSIDSAQSFNHLQSWMQQIKENANSGNEVTLALVGNKCDLQNGREVTLEQGQQLAKKYGIGFMQVSAKLNKNLQKIFEELGKKILTKNGKILQNPQRKKQSIIVQNKKKDDKNEKKNKKKKDCCQ